MILKEFPALCREKLCNSDYWVVILISMLAHACLKLKLKKLKAWLVPIARKKYWAYVIDRQREFDIALKQWTGPVVFRFVFRRWRARNKYQIKVVNIRAWNMREAWAKLHSYNQGPEIRIYSYSSNGCDRGVWAEVTNTKPEYLATEPVPAVPVVLAPDTEVTLIQGEMPQKTKKAMEQAATLTTSAIPPAL
ncbi:MAG: hypothetical protein ABW007_19020 [Chitinophagaceae bacterium]